MRHENLQSQAAMPLDQAFNVFATPTDSEALGYHEWAVVDMARQDGPRSANPDSIINRLARTLFGVSVPRALANERLEALRRFGVAAWFRKVIRVNELRSLFAAGFSSNDAARVLAYVAANRGTVPEVEAWP